MGCLFWIIMISALIYGGFGFMIDVFTIYLIVRGAISLFM